MTRTHPPDSKEQPMTQVITSPELMTPNGPFSQAILVPPSKSLLFIAGMVPRNKEGEVVGIGDMEAQARQVLTNMEAVVREAGGTLDDVVRLDVYVTDVAMAAPVHAVRREFFTGRAPTATMVEVSGFFSPEYLVEMTAVAAI